MLTSDLTLLGLCQHIVKASAYSAIRRRYDDEAVLRMEQPRYG